MIIFRKKLTIKKKTISITIILMIILNLFTLTSLEKKNSPIDNINHINGINFANSLQIDDKNFVLDSEINNYWSLDTFSEIFPKVHENLEPFFLKNEESKTLDIFIVFNNGISTSDRNSIISNIPIPFEIVYDYQLIPSALISLKSSDLLEIYNYIQITKEVKYIKYNEGIYINNFVEQGFNTDFLQTASNNESALDNWWLDVIGLDGVALNGKDVNIAILDTGITVHPDFYENGNSRIIKAKNFTYEENVFENIFTYDTYGHGTHCAGIAAGNGYASDGLYQGVAPKSNLINAKISNSSGYIDEGHVIAAIEWCINENADVLSLSFGGTFPTVWDLEALAIQNAVKSGVVVVSSAGNSGPTLFSTGSPGSAMNSISVGATDRNNNLATFTSYGPSNQRQLLPDIVAPGVNIISTESEGSFLSQQNEYINNYIKGKDDFDYLPISGTSMSCPMVAGAIALLLEAFPEATPETIRNALIHGSKKLNRTSELAYGDGEGAGLLNVRESLEYLEQLDATLPNINQNLMIFPRSLPYSPYDLLKFPGDSQIMNLTIYSGSAVEYEIICPQLEGINISCNEQSISRDAPGLNSIVLEIGIFQNSTPGVKSGFIEIRDLDSGYLLDQIPVIITVSIPRSNVYFDSYHSMSDSMNYSTFSFAQYQMYHAIRDLYSMNISADFNMEKWQYGYNSSSDAEMLNSALLSNYNLIILQTPLIPYSQFEIEAIVEYYNSGGSILFLGTIREHMDLESSHNLFEALNTSIKIDENLFEYNDYAQYAILSPLQIDTTNATSPIFNNVSSYTYSFGCSFESNENVSVLSSIGDKNLIIESQTQSEDQGKFIAVGDYHFLLDGTYNSLSKYENHRKMWENLVDYLIVDTSIESFKKTQINIESRSQKDPILDFNFYLSNKDTIIQDLDLNNISISLIHPNETVSYLTQYQNENFIFSTQLYLNDSDGLLPYKLKIEIDYLGIVYESSRNFYYFPEIKNHYGEVSLNSSYIDRSNGNSYGLVYDIENGLLNDYVPYISIFNPSYLISNGVHQIHSNFQYYQENATVILKSEEIISSGYLITYVTLNQTNNELNDTYTLDLTPSRELFTVINYPPIIDEDQSNFGNYTFSSTQSNGRIMPIEVLIGEKYTINIKIQNLVNHEDDFKDLIVVGAYFPIIIYNSYINFLPTENIPTFNLIYNPSTENFEADIVIQRDFNYSTINGIYGNPLVSNLNSIFSLIWIKIRDLDGGSYDYQLLLIPSESTINLYNFKPILVFIGLIGVAIYILNKWKK